jgi:NNP family nitrate/nitrite transporter-like MFS transporter
LPLATAAFLTILFDLPSGAIRALGGWASDKVGGNQVTWWVLWISLVSLVILSYPPTTMVIHGIKGDVAFSIEVGIVLFTILIFVLGLAQGFGKASVYRSLADHYPKSMGVVGGIVGRHRRSGRFHPADHVRCRRRRGRGAQQLLHAPGRRRGGHHDLDLAGRKQRKGRDPLPARRRARAPNCRTRSCWNMRAGDGISWSTGAPTTRPSGAASGRRIANRNLLFSMPALLLAFAVWVVWSVIVVELPHIGYQFSTNQLFWLRRCRDCRGLLSRTLFIRGTDLRRPQLDGLQHRLADPADSLDRLRSAGPRNQLCGVCSDCLALRSGGRVISRRAWPTSASSTRNACKARRWD